MLLFISNVIIFNFMVIHYIPFVWQAHDFHRSKWHISRQAIVFYNFVRNSRKNATAECAAADVQTLDCCPMQNKLILLLKSINCFLGVKVNLAFKIGHIHNPVLKMAADDFWSDLNKQCLFNILYNVAHLLSACWIMFLAWTTTFFREINRN